MTITVGTHFDRYEILAPLGAGGMGEVYLAQDTRLQRTVALKFLPAEFAADAGRMRRFVQEAKAASALNHPNIITIHEIGESDATHFIALEFVDGETLRQHIKRGRMPVGEALAAALQIASALAAAHEAGIVHRDIKPENIMLRRRDAYVKVLDFGLAKLSAPPAVAGGLNVDTEASTRFKTAAGMVLGTVSYMSPEQARGTETDARTDIWSLGVVLYELVAGCLPFAGATTSDVLAAILSKQEPPPLARFAREVPAEMERIVAKALRKERAERYQTVKDMRLDLKSLKHRLEFEAELERSQSPEASSSTTVPENSNRMTAAGAVAPATPGNAAAQTAPVTASLASRSKQHRRSLMIALAVLVGAAAGLAYLFYSARPASAIDSIAVLPLVNASNDPNTEYLSDGISEALINSLTELRQLRVIARSTAFRYKGKDVDPQAVGRELHVRVVLMGRVRQVGDRLNIQVDLVDASTGAQLWGAEYERRVSDVLTVKQAIAREVTEKLRLKLSGEQQQQLTKRDTTNREAYEFYCFSQKAPSACGGDECVRALGFPKGAQHPFGQGWGECPTREGETCGA